MTPIGAPFDYEQARARVERKRKFRGNLIAYVVINVVFVAIWAFNGGGAFWPGLVLAAWGVGLILAAWDAFYRHDVTEEDIQREMRNRR